MKLLIACIAAIFITSHTFAGPTEDYFIKNESELDMILSKIPFNGTYLVSKNGQILRQKAVGLRRLTLEENNKFLPENLIHVDDLMQIGSNTKQFVAVAILMLQENKQLSLNDEIVKYFPDLTQFQGIKVKNLLNHTSGIPNYTDFKEFMILANEGKIKTSEDIFNFIKDKPLEFSPNAKWNYSNTGFILAGMIIEKVTGRIWSEYIKSEILTPLGMRHTGYYNPFNDNSLVRGHVFGDKGIVEFPIFNLAWADSAGAFSSNVSDLEKWLDIYENSNLISEESKQFLKTPFLNNYSLGLFVNQKFNDTVFYHGGRTPGFISDMIYFSKAKLKIIVLDNNDGLGTEKFKDTLSRYYMNQPIQRLKQLPIAPHVESYQNYVGKFISEEIGLLIEVTHLDGKIYFQVRDGHQMPIESVEVDLDSFNLANIAGVEFKRNQSNEIDSLILFQNGKERVFVRTK